MLKFASTGTRNMLGLLLRRHEDHVGLAPNTKTVLDLLRIMWGLVGFVNDLNLNLFLIA